MSAVARCGDRNVHLSCRIRCKPPLTALFWVINDRGTAVSDGQIVGDYWMLVQVSCAKLLQTVVLRFTEAVDCSNPEFFPIASYYFRF